MMFEKVADAALELWPEYEPTIRETAGPTNITYAEEAEGLRFQIRTADVRMLLVSEFCLSKLPGTLWLYSHGAHVASEYRSNGIGLLLNNFRKRIAYEAGAWGLIAFVRGDNETQRRLLLKAGWKCVDEIWDYDLPDVDRHTGYSQEIWTYTTDKWGMRLRE